MIARLRLFVLIAVVIAVTPLAAHAQQPNDSRSELTAGPRIEATATAFRQLTYQRLDDLASMQRRTRESKSVALMIVGGAALVIGAVIGDDVGTLFMIGGAVALLIGLYQYLQ
jgi:hypothetical protein